MNATVTTTKPATKAAAKTATKPAPKAATKPAAKPAKAAPKAASKAKPAVKGSGIKFALVAGVARPGSGGMLKAHTQAVIELTGLDKGASVEKAILRKVMGDTALRYNVDNGKMQVADGKVSLTAAGLAMLASRAEKVDAGLVDAYKAVMTKGEPVESVCKNKDAIIAVA